MQPLWLSTAVLARPPSVCSETRTITHILLLFVTASTSLPAPKIQSFEFIGFSHSNGNQWGSRTLTVQPCNLYFYCSLHNKSTFDNKLFDEWFCMLNCSNGIQEKIESTTTMSSFCTSEFYYMKSSWLLDEDSIPLQKKKTLKAFKLSK